MPTEEIEATRHRLRPGILPVELLKGGRDVVLRSADRHVTRDELRTDAEQVAGGLHELGVKPGDRVGMHAASSLDWVSAYLGAQRSGACVVPMNPDYRSAEVEHIVTNADPLLVITDEERAATVEGLGRRAVNVHKAPHGVPPPMPDLISDSPAAILYTSGTTGRPKGAVLDHGGLLAQARGAIEMWRWSTADILVHALPLFHLHGLGMGLHGTLLSGASATFVPFAPAAVVAELPRDDAGGGAVFFG